jgi:hypothetical protein
MLKTHDYWYFSMDVRKVAAIGFEESLTNDEAILNKSILIL